MRYRDDRDALRQRADELQLELELAERQLKEAEDAVEQHERKDEQDEKQLSELRDQVAALKQRLGEADEDKDKGAKPSEGNDGYATGVRVAMGVAIMVMGTSVLVVSQTRSTHDEVEVAVVEPAEPEDPEMTASQGPSPVPPPPPESVFFGAEVIRQDNARVAVGSGCLLHAEVLRGLKLHALTLSCGARTLYDSRDALGTATSQRETNLDEVSGPHPDTARYQLRYVDIGQRTGPRSQIDLNTAHHRIHVYKKGPDPWSALLHVRDVSFARHGSSLGIRLPSPATFSGGVYALARLDTREGTLPQELTENAKQCDLAIRATGHQHNCRFMLRCGSYIVYGADGAGYGNCRIEGGRPVSMEDSQKTHDDNDPKVIFDWKKRTLEVEDGQYDRTWRASFKLSDAPGCGWDKVLRGYAYPNVEPTRPLSFQAIDKQLKVHWPDNDELKLSARDDAVPVPQDCSLAALDVSTQARHYFIERGPGNKTLGGYFRSTDGKLKGELALSRP